MTNAEIRETVLRILTNIAPEVRGQDLAPAANLRDQLDLDSMDALNFVIAPHEEFGVEIPETDYAKLTTLDGIVAILAPTSQTVTPDRMAGNPTRLSRRCWMDSGDSPGNRGQFSCGTKVYRFTLWLAICSHVRHRGDAFGRVPRMQSSGIAAAAPETF